MSDGAHRDPAGYRATVAEALATGWRFAGLHATSDAAHVRTLLVGEDGSTRLETVATPEHEAVSIVDLAPAAGWDEREAADLHGIDFAGHSPLRPLVNHDAPLSAWTVCERSSKTAAPDGRVVIIENGST